MILFIGLALSIPAVYGQLNRWLGINNSGISQAVPQLWNKFRSRISQRSNNSTGKTPSISSLRSSSNKPSTPSKALKSHLLNRVRAL
jgi:hypothetical protein